MAFDKNKTSLGMKVVIVGFAVILVASLCLPFFSSCSNTTADSQGDDSSSSSGTEQEAYTVAEVQQQYQTLLDSLVSRHEEDPDNLTYAASLGNNYMDCGVSMKSATDADENEETIAETFRQAVAYYDEYLAGAEADDTVTEGDVSAVTVDRAVCLFYAGDEDEAIADLEAFLETTPDYAMGWYNLGAFYEQQGDTEKAKEAYNTAIEKDPDGETGAGTYAQFRLMLIEAVEEAAAEEDSDASASDGDAATDDGAADAGADADAAADSDADASDDAAVDGASDESSSADEGGESGGDAATN